jgi:uncharacterized protein (DUF952 family)
MTEKLIFKIVLPDEWRAAREAGVYRGSAHDKADGFLHFSTAAQLPETLRLYYTAASAVEIVAVDTEALGSELKYERSPSRNEDFPHLYGPLPMSAVVSTMYKSMHPVTPANNILEWWLSDLEKGKITLPPTP